MKAIGKIYFYGMEASFISVRGARLHNLRNVNADFPVGQISVVCGPSGCGKSSLVLDVLHAESRRRYLETLSPSALQLLGGPRHIPVDAVMGLRPSIALESDAAQVPAKANVASLAELSPSLRLLWAALATPACPHCGAPMISHDMRELAMKLSSYPEGSRVQILAPIAPQGRTLDELASLFLAQGYTRCLADQAAYGLDQLKPDDAARIPKEFFVVVDRIVVKQNQRSRLSEALDAALRISTDLVGVDANGQQSLYSTRPRCPEHGGDAPLLLAAHFSPWSPKGQCPECHGQGADAEGNECASCQGLGLSQLARRASWEGLDYESLHGKTLKELPSVLGPLIGNLPAHLKTCARDLLPRLEALETLGLGYLSLGRRASTLSGGELQRLRLAGLATGHLDGVLLCLDEPASGLHAKDVEKLWSLLAKLKERGNTVILIEHHPGIIGRADYVVEMGPGAGEQGGEVLYQGAAREFLALEHSPTARWLKLLAKEKPEKKALPATQALLTVRGACLHNLRGLDYHVPVGAFTVLCGVSGSGKSSLLWDSLYPLANGQLQGKAAPAGCGEIEMPGIEAVAGIQAGFFGANRRSTVATAIGLMSPLRDLFASLPESKVRGYTAARFGTSSPGGRCETCKGEGVLRDPYGYEESECPICMGNRYKDEVLEIRFKTYSMAQILEMTVEQALKLFTHFSNYTAKLQPLCYTGLGYLRLGQSTTHMSGGELQRLRLSLELAKAKGPRTLYLFDEPARGLHQGDIAKLLELLKGLTAQGHTVVAIEHQPDFALAADYVLEMGPGAGAEGGRFIS